MIACPLNLYNNYCVSYLFQIEDGDIYASINQRDGMVSFHQNPEKYNNPKMLKKLDTEVGLSFLSYAYDKMNLSHFIIKLNIYYLYLSPHMMLSTLLI